MPWARKLEYIARAGGSAVGPPVDDYKDRRLGAAQGAIVKSKLCVFWQNNLCKRGDSCTYAHGTAELQTAPDLVKTSLCRNMTNGSCTIEGCPFAHSTRELRSTDNVYKTKICSVWATGKRCWDGALCRYAHGESELRQVTNGSGGYEKVSDDDDLNTDAAVDSPRALETAPLLQHAQRQAQRQRQPLLHASCVQQAQQAQQGQPSFSSSHLEAMEPAQLRWQPERWEQEMEKLYLLHPHPTQQRVCDSAAAASSGALDSLSQLPRAQYAPRAHQAQQGQPPFSSSQLELERWQELCLLQTTLLARQQEEMLQQFLPAQPQ
jgi:hypothetical protein